MSTTPHTETQTFLAWAGKHKGRFWRGSHGFSEPVLVPYMQKDPDKKRVRVRVTLTMTEIPKRKGR